MNRAAFLDALRTAIRSQSAPPRGPAPDAVASLLEGAHVFIGGALEKGKTKVGQSKVGGRPDLPAGFEWPHEEDDDDAPLGFVAQIDLAEVAPHDLDHALPERGMLWFFSVLDGDRAGGGEIDASTTAVRFAADPGELTPHDLPEAFADDEDAEIDERPIVFGPSVAIPSHDADVRAMVERSLVTLGGRRGPVGMLGAHASSVVLASFDGYTIARNAFGEGYLDFVVSAADLAERRFSAVDTAWSGGT